MDNLKMLPEYLFMVGHSMQDISRDDFPLLNGVDSVSNSTDKDMCPTLISRIQNISPINPSALYLSKQLNNEENAVQTYAAVKLEDAGAVDLFPSHPSTWQQHPMNTNHELAQHRLPLHSHSRFDHNNTKLLLQGSDDPLISHGANSVLSNDDEHPADFAKSLIAAPAVQQPNSQERTILASQQQPEQIQQRPIKSGCSNLTKQQLKVKANLMSARNQQQIQINNALLNASSSLPSTSQKQQRNPKVKKKPGNIVKLRFHHQALPPEYLSHYEATQGQVRTSKSQQKLTTTQQRNPTKPTSSQPKQSQSKNSHENVRSWLQKIAEIQRTANASKEGGNQMQHQQQQQQQLAHPAQPQSQKDTEKTYATQQISNRLHLDVNNNHPKTHHRHLHIQNQASSTSFACNMNTDNNSNGGYLYSDLPYMGEITLDNCKPRRGRKPKKADICHLIYKNYGTILPKKPEPQDCPSYANGTLTMKTHAIKPDSEEQPLNLCLRDQPADSYSISSGDEISETNSSCPTPISTITPSDFVRDSMLANNLKNSLSNLNGFEQSDKVKLDGIGSTVENPGPANKLPTNSTPEENVLHPVTMYYQKLLESGVLLHNANGPFKTIQKDNQLSLKIPIPSGFFLPHKVDKSASSPAPSHLDYPEQLSTPSSIKSENSLTTNSSSAANQQQLAPQKRKRSAIFIPPMNTENTTNPATEVSICKFKFTGGSKPTLQEKKMLSVDAGGNYRYFSGTGDKSTRGYEYFPRESLQQTAGLLPGVNCTGQRLLIDIPPPSAGLSNELLHIPESPTSSMLLSANSSNASALTDLLPPKSPAAGPPFEVSKNEACTNNFVENSTYPSSSPNTSSANRCVAPRKKHGAIQQQLQRKSTQREKMEKTFKEQGFLIQTQQLESAEGATYCKFRQLKKFTRYLFRNWKDYLPDDLQQYTNAAALAAASAADFSTNQQETSTATTLSVKTTMENTTTCVVDNILD